MVVLPLLLLIFIKNKKALMICVKTLCIVYFCLLAVGVFGKIDMQNGNFIVTFETNGSWFDFKKFTPYSFGTFNVLINLYMLFPIGAIGVVSLQNHKLIKTALLSFCISFFIESMQLILPIARSVEITDLVYNTISGVIGYCFFAIMLKICKKEDKF